MDIASAVPLYKPMFILQLSMCNIPTINVFCETSLSFIKSFTSQLIDYLFNYEDIKNYVWIVKCINTYWDE